MNRKILEVRDLRKYFPLPANPLRRGERPVVRAVDGVSFAIPEGETLGLIGESGCGKSTTVKLLLRLESPTDGQILFDGKEVQNSHGKDLRTYRSQVQAVFQDPYSSLSPKRTVFQAIAEPLHAAKRFSREEIIRRVNELLDIVGLPSTAQSRLPHEFSGGQRQRIAIARGLALQPRLLILDEPVSALDVSIRAQILNLLQDLQKQFGLSYLLISHDLDIVTHMCQSAAVMYLGKIVEIGPMDVIRSSPQHPYTRALFSSVLPTNLEQEIQRIRLHGSVPSPINPPSGCSFHTRCPSAQPICSQQLPPRITTAHGSTAVCHLLTADERTLEAVP
ncbi:MAG TPA: oligopeptide/dipeptide ABC transporter ATP-binding protein [Sphingobium sp.]|nr:oligopeptide/dipeptide ABC transporter ATP-binding protein [Sphingobium sp.]